MPRDAVSRTANVGILITISAFVIETYKTINILMALIFVLFLDIDRLLYFKVLCFILKPIENHSC